MSADFVRINWCGKHFGEEPPLVGKKGSGTIFFTGCNLRCVFCQNHEISQTVTGKKYDNDELVDIMLGLQAEEAANINLVTPTIWHPVLLTALTSARQKGLTIPVIWNSNGYEKVEMLRKFEDLVDIYLPDFKYGENKTAKHFSKIEGYVEKAKAAIKEMKRQVGRLRINEDGYAEKGLLVRHLIMPGHVENSLKVLQILADINPQIHISLMSQYYPAYKALDYPPLNRKLNPEEFKTVQKTMLELGLENGWCQDFDSSEDFLPDFEQETPFKNLPDDL
jgi:putative pyruvate formate lyase activating enzyme